MRRGGRFLMYLMFGVLAVAVLGWGTQLLWNWIVPTLFAGPVIHFWQALGLLVLSKLLFSGFGRHGCNHDGCRNRLKHRMHEKFSGMSADEREVFKKRMMDKWCTRKPQAAPGNAEEKFD